MNDVLPSWARVVAAMAAGGLCMAALPGVADVLAPQAPLLWRIGRVSGLVAYVALWATMLAGVGIGSRGAGGWLNRAVLFDLHRSWSLVAVLATGVHVLALVGDPESGVPAVAAVVPFASPRLRGAVAVGTVAGWGLVALMASTVFRNRLPSWVWRAIHASAFGSFLLALVHGVTAGSDVTRPEVRLAFASTATVLVAAVLQRVALAAFPPVRPERARPPRG